MRKIVLVCLMVLALFVPLYAGGSGESSSADGTVVLEILLSGDTTEGSPMQKAVERFNAEYADKGIQAQVNEISLSDLPTQVSNRIRAGKLPALVKNTTNTFEQFTDNFYPLDETGLDPNDFTMNYSVRGGRFVSTTLNSTAVGLFLNTTLWDEAGVPYPTTEEERWTWDEFLGICRKAKETGGMDAPLLMDSGWGLSSRQGEWLSYFLISILAQNDAGCLDEGSHARGVLDSPAAIKALDFAASLFRSGYSHINDRRELFPNDMLMSVSESRAYFALPDSVKDEIGILPLPHMKRKAAAHGGWGLCISKQSKKPAESWDVIRSFFSIENQLKLFKVVGMPARKDVYGICRDFKAINHDHETLFRQLSECSVTRPQTPAYPFISKMIGHALIEAANGADPGIVLNIAARQIDDNFYRHSYYPVFDSQEN